MCWVLKKSLTLDWEWWHVPVFLATREMGGLLKFLVCLKIYCFIMYAVFCLLYASIPEEGTSSLQMTLSYHVVAGN